MRILISIVLLLSYSHLVIEGKKLLLLRLQTEENRIFTRQTDQNLKTWCDRCSESDWHCDYRVWRSVPVPRIQYQQQLARLFVAWDTLEEMLGTVGPRPMKDAWLFDESIGAVEPGYDVVIYVDPEVVLIPAKNMNGIIDELWQKLFEGKETQLVFFADRDGKPDPSIFIFRATHEAKSLLKSMDDFPPNLSTDTPLKSWNSSEQVSHFASEHEDDYARLVHIVGAAEHGHVSDGSMFRKDDNSQSCEEAFSLVHYFASQDDDDDDDEDDTRLLFFHLRDTVCSIVELAEGARKLNEDPSMPSLPVGFQDPELPLLGLVAYGEEHNRKETSHFLRSLLIHRSAPLRIYIIGDPIGLGTLLEVMQETAGELFMSGDEIRLINMDTLDVWKEILRHIHWYTKMRHVRLFIKLFTHQLFPHVDKIMLMDNDLIILDDIYGLWDEFDHFSEEQLFSLAIDQSTGYYHRFQKRDDEAHSPGWIGVANQYGINGGVQLWHNGHVRRKYPFWTQYLIKLTHSGVELASVGSLQNFGLLQEQDLINLVVIERPETWRPLDCIWNYLPKTYFGVQGGHITSQANGTLATLMDQCSLSDGEEEAYGCSCGRRVRLVHYVGATKSSNPQAKQMFEFWGHGSTESLKMIAHENLRTADEPEVGYEQAVSFPCTGNAGARKHPRGGRHRGTPPPLLLRDAPPQPRQLDHQSQSLQSSATRRGRGRADRSGEESGEESSEESSEGGHEESSEESSEGGHEEADTGKIRSRDEKQQATANNRKKEEL